MLLIPQARVMLAESGCDIVRASPNFRGEQLATFVDRIGSIPSNFNGPLFVLAEYDALSLGILQLSGESRTGRLMLVDRSLFFYLPDPFQLNDHFTSPPDSQELEDLLWPDTQGLWPRTVEALDAILREGNGPTLLGATQALVDSEQITLVAEAPNERMLRQIWAFLPESTRRTTTISSFCFAERPTFQLCFVPKLPEPLERYLDEERVLDYPDSRYERMLQIAIESGDQRELDRLLSRRSTNDTVRLFVMILLFLAFVSLASRFFE